MYLLNILTTIAVKLHYLKLNEAVKTIIQDMNNLRQKVNIHKETVVGCPTNFDISMV